MFNLDGLLTAKNSRRLSLTAGVMAFGLIVSGSANAAQPLLFPFLPLPLPLSAGPAPIMPQATPQIEADDEGTTTEAPARFKRQIVSYQTREAAGTIVIDTGNTYLYYVLGDGRAIRYGIGVGRQGFTWSGTQSITRKAEWKKPRPQPANDTRTMEPTRYKRTPRVMRARWSNLFKDSSTRCFHRFFTITAGARLVATFCR